MTYDALTMHAVRDELERTLLGGHIDAVYLIDPRRVGLEIFANHARHWLVLSLDRNDSRVYLADERLRRGTDQVTPFLLLLRKYVRGSRIVAVEQPRLERLLTLRCEVWLEDQLPKQVELIAEVMGRRSNLTLVDEDGSIMDVLDRVPPSVNPGRLLLPHLRYTPPPREQKPDPTQPDLPLRLRGAASAHHGAASELLVRTVSGLSPLAAREALVRSGHTTDVRTDVITSWDDVVAALAELCSPISTGEWQPSIAWQGENALGYASYPLRQFPDAEIRTYESMSEVVRLATARQVRVGRFDRSRRPLLEALSARAEQARRKRSSLERSLAAADDADELRTAGELLLANAHAIPAGAASFEWEGRRIDLYPTLSAVENAQSYFKRYTDARDARRVVPPLLEEVEAELVYLDEMMVHVELADSEPELAALRRELLQAGVVRDRGAAKTKSAKGKGDGGTQSGAYRRISIPGAELLVGQSAVGNDTVTFRLAQPDDLWFHARGVPGAHVVLRARGGSLEEQQIEAAARAAASRSAARKSGRVEVDYTARRYVRRVPGTVPGRVTYSRASTIAIEPGEVDDVARSA